MSNYDYEKENYVLKNCDNCDKQAENQTEKKHVKVNIFFKNRFAVLQNKSETEIDEILSQKASKKVRYCGLKNTCKQIDTCKYEHIKLISKNEKNRKQKPKGKKYQRDFLKNKFAALQNKSETEINEILNQKENKKQILWTEEKLQTSKQLHV